MSALRGARSRPPIVALTVADEPLSVAPRLAKLSGDMRAAILGDPCGPLNLVVT